MKTTALRLTLTYQENDIRLASASSVSRILQRTNAFDDREISTGVWVELRDSAGVTLYRQALHSPIGSDQEVLTDDPNAGLTYAAFSGQRTVLIDVPDFIEATTVVLIGPKTTIFDLSALPIT